MIHNITLFLTFLIRYQLFYYTINYHDTQQIFYDAEDKSIIANDYGVREVKRRNIEEYDDDEEEYNFGD